MEAELGKRQGQRTDLASENQCGLLELPQNFAEVAGKETIEIAAGKSGFGNKETYRQAKTVAHHGVDPTVMSSAAISIRATPVGCSYRG